MKRAILSVLLLTLFIAGCRDVPYEEATGWTSLFNGSDLSGWDTYLGPPHDGIEIPDSLTRFEEEAMGLNYDPMQVFTVVEEGGAPAIRISGQIWGGISTADDFQDYHLKLEFKWGQKRWPPRDKAKRDSGVLYHAVGPHAAGGAFWMRSHELQVQEGDCGDYWGVAGAIADIPATVTLDSSYRYHTGAPMRTFSPYNETGRHCIKYPDTEKPTGEWNTLELFCHGDTSVHLVNGVRNMVLFNLRQSGNGETFSPLAEGKIQIQSEGAEVFYRNIRIRPLEQIPENYLKQQD